MGANRIRLFLPGLLVPLLLAACSDASERGDVAPRATSTAPGTGTATEEPTSAPLASSPVLAVITQSQSLQLYSLTEGAQPGVRRLRTLPGPPGARATAVTLARGSNPRVCAVWSRGQNSTVRCYDGKTGRPQEVSGAKGNVGAVALSVSGKQLAWTVHEVEGKGVTLVAQRTAGGPLQRIPSYSAVEEEDILGVGDLAWSGESTLLVSHSYDADVNGSIAVVPLSPAPRNWTAAPEVEVDGVEYAVLRPGAASSTDNGQVLAGLQILTDPPSHRAVQLDVAAGRVTGTFATAARYLRSVSGGPSGVLYVTEVGTGVRTYWRAPDQQRGTPIAGIPSTVFAVVAQP